MLTKEDLEKIQKLFGKTLKREFKPLKDDMASVRKRTEVVLNSLLVEHIRLRRKVEKLEEMLKIPASD